MKIELKIPFENKHCLHLLDKHLYKKYCPLTPENNDDARYVFKMAMRIREYRIDLTHKPKPS
jgi:hypothetical protein